MEEGTECENDEVYARDTFIIKSTDKMIDSFHHTQDSNTLRILSFHQPQIMSTILFRNGSNHFITNGMKRCCLQSWTYTKEPQMTLPTTHTFDIPPMVKYPIESLNFSHTPPSL